MSFIMGGDFGGYEKADDGEVTWTVESGDSLSLVSKTIFGDFSHVQEIADANGIANINVIRVGQVLKIPGTKRAESPMLVPLPAQDPNQIPYNRPITLPAEEPIPYEQPTYLPKVEPKPVFPYPTPAPAPAPAPVVPVSLDPARMKASDNIWTFLKGITPSTTKKYGPLTAMQWGMVAAVGVTILTFAAAASGSRRKAT